MPTIQQYELFFTTIALRYFIIAGIASLIWYLLLRKRVSYKKIQPRFPAQKDYRREISYSIVTMFIFAILPCMILFTSFRQYTQFYSDIHQHSMFYFWIAFPIMLIVHDTYFYWTHRMMHHPKIFKVSHLVHHKSVNPSPWAAYSFHPVEAVIEAGIFLLLVMIMPIHKYHLIFFFLFMILYNVYGHLGWELYPKNFNRHWLGKWVNTSINHNQHHQHFKGNYSLYFLWWDRWMKTIREDYDEKFDEVKNRVSKVA